MEERSPTSIIKPNREGRPLRRRGVSFNVLPHREESPTVPAPSEPILVDYASIRERKQLNLSDFLDSDNPITFVLLTFWRTLCLFGQLFLLPFILMKYVYLLLLQVYGVRRSSTTTSTSDLFSISSSQATIPQQRPIVWLLTLIDYVLFQLTRLPDTLQQLLQSMRKHIDGTVLRSFHLIDMCTSHQITRALSMFKNVAFERTDSSKTKTKR